MIWIYAQTTSPRLQYITNFICKELLGISCEVLIDSEAFEKYKGAKINYSNTSSSGLNLCSHPLLFENDIKEQTINCFEINEYKAFFKTANSDYPFDIFAASFFLLSRYEEYLPHTKDMYGRYAHTNALAYKENFLQLPLINIWVIDFAKKLKEKYPAIKLKTNQFSFVPTYDIDIAFSFLHKGWLRNMGGFIKNPSLERIKVLLRLKKDPFDNYDWLNEQHKKNNVHPVYFFLVAKKNGQYDKNILPHKNIMWQLIGKHSKKYTIGIHPSWQSGDNEKLLHQEITQLQAMQLNATHQITTGRQHYIRFNLPDGFERLLQEGITNDYSMGYGSINGFRASVASPFYWYNLKEEESTSLRIHPFCFMDANSFYEQKFSAAQAYAELLLYYLVCKKVGGTMITIWHNDFFSNAKQTIEWKNFYALFLQKIKTEQA
jgi:hypothetical protein